MAQQLSEKEKKSIEHLLKKRFKVIADYPNSGDKVGDIYTLDNVLQSGFYQRFPHLFKELQWWEDRSIEELPEYLRFLGNMENGFVFKVLYYSPNDSPWIAYPKSENGVDAKYNAPLKDCTPATESEYLEYINQKP